MKLSYEDKVRMYRSWKRGEKSPYQIARENGLSHAMVDYMLNLMNLHGEEMARHGKNRYYSPKFKEKAIKRVLIGNEAVWAVSIHLGLPHQGTLSAWIKSYKENGYTVIERKRGRHGKKETEDNRRIRSRTESLEGRELEAYHRERILKKIRCLG
ncbi:MAG: transposase, partial [Erysipelotrichaceae bacterium]|nr:transposase [Erysipelotrichaceae bacterium]